MKNLFVVLLFTLEMSAPFFAEELSYEIDPIATANAPWKVGERIIEKDNCGEAEYYRKFLGVTLSGLALVQDFYLAGEKLNDPFLMIISSASKKTRRGVLCRKDMEGSYIEWHKNGQKRLEANWENGTIDGLLISWYENGQEKLEAYLENGSREGFLIRWYENGQKQEQGNYQNGKIEGLGTKWYENGQKQEEGNFKNSEQVGIWRYWDEKGNLLEEKDFGDPKNEPN